MTQVNGKSDVAAAVREAGSTLAMFELDERDLLFNAYFDGELTQAERVAFEARLEGDAAMRREYDAFLRVVGGVRALPFEFAPDDFVERVQSRIRKRSKGRFFADNYLNTSRVPYEVIALVMMVVMAAAYMMMEAPRDAALIGADVTIDSPRTLEKPPVNGRRGEPVRALP